MSVKREAGNWFLVLSCELEDVAIPKSTNPAAGFDSGLESFLTNSDGEHTPNPRFLKSAQAKIRKKSRKLSRAKEKSKNRKKAKLQLQKAHAKITNQRRNFGHQLSHNLVNRFGLIAAESLSIGNMLRNHRLALAISDAGWGSFWDMVRYKAINAGVEFITVDPRYTSQVCSGCGVIVQKELSERWHNCPHCGLCIHRDINAAINILALARTEPKDGVRRINPALQHRKQSSSMPPQGRPRSRKLQPAE